MNHIKFAQMVAEIARQHAISFTTDELADMFATIEAGIEKPKIEFQPATHDQIAKAASIEVATMMRAMADNKLMDAIRACRMLTGLGLKEAKDMVEAARTNFKP